MCQLRIKQFFGNVNKKILYLVYYVQTDYIMLCDRNVMYVLPVIFMNLYASSIKYPFAFSQIIKDTGKGEIVCNGQFDSN